MKNLKEFGLEEKVRRPSMYLSRFSEGDKKEAGENNKNSWVMRSHVYCIN